MLFKSSVVRTAIAFSILIINRAVDISQETRHSACTARNATNGVHTLSTTAKWFLFRFVRTSYRVQCTFLQRTVDHRVVAQREMISKRIRGTVATKYRVLMYFKFRSFIIIRYYHQRLLRSMWRPLKFLRIKFTTLTVEILNMKCKFFIFVFIYKYFKTNDCIWNNVL